ncbi:MAG: roadblock/LC7 domain-containing protein [Gemmatimonadota bacterium]
MTPPDPGGPAEAGGARLDAILASFLDETQARCAVLLDRDGRLLALTGETTEFDGTAFATLAAADFAAGDRLASLLGEDEFTSLYHQGEDHSMYLVDIGGTAILAALFDDDRSSLGLVRLTAKRAVPRFATLLAERPGEDLHVEGLGDGWADEAGSEVDRLFRD